MKRTVICVVVFALAAAGCDWSLPGFNGANTNANISEPGLTVQSAPALQHDWESECIWECFDPLVSGNLVYFSEQRGGVNPRPVRLHAVDARTGADRWSFDFELIDMAQFVAVGNGLAYATWSGPDDPYGELIAFDATSGALRWRRPWNGSYTVDGTRLLEVGSNNPNGDAVISGIDGTGQTIWVSNPPGKVDDYVLDPSRGDMYVASHVELTTPAGVRVPFLTRYDTATGLKETQIQLPQTIQNLRFENNLIYTGSSAIRPDTGATVWSAPAGERIVAVTPSETLIRTGTTLRSRNALSGALKWSVTDEGRLQAVGGQLIFSSPGGDEISVTVRSLANGGVLGSLTSPWQSEFRPGLVIVGAGHVFALGIPGIVAFALEKVRPTTSVIRPQNGGIVSGTTLLGANSADNVGVGKVEFRLTGGTLKDAVVGVAANTSYGWVSNWNTAAVPNGSYVLTSVATDYANNSARSSNVTITVRN